jgi:hypothetical protein
LGHTFRFLLLRRSSGDGLFGHLGRVSGVIISPPEPRVEAMGVLLLREAEHVVRDIVTKERMSSHTER